MKGSTHLAGGLLAGALITPISTEMPGALLTIGAAALAALVPDWLQINLPGANTIVRGLAGHRGFSHWYITALIASWIVAVAIAPGYALAVMAGVSSHILLDCFSGGAPALWPLPGRIVLANIKTGSRLDSVMGGALLVLAAIVIIRRFL